MSGLSEIDLISRDVMARTKVISELGQAWTASRAGLSGLSDSLVSEASSLEIKQRFQVVAMDVAEKGCELGSLRKELREVTTRLLEMVKADGHTSLTTLDGVELTMIQTMQFKFPPPAGVEESKE